MKIVWTLSLLVVGALSLAACGGDDGGGSDAGVERPSEIQDLTGMDVVEIDVADNKYEPRNFRVDPGAQIVFTNVGSDPHNVTPSDEGAFVAIDDETLSEGPATLVIDADGDYPFYCTIHGTPTAGQTGYLVVGAG